MWQATVHWRSVQQPSIALSLYQSEIMAASEATKDVLSYRRLKAELESYVKDGEVITPPEAPPTKQYVDNQAAIASAYNPENHGKLKTSSGATSSSAKPSRTATSSGCGTRS